MTRYGESLTEWAELHGETITATPAPVEHCDHHGDWVYRFGGADECPQCAAAYDALARADADREPRQPQAINEECDTWPS